METKNGKENGDCGACPSKRVAIPGSDRSKVREEESNRIEKAKLGGRNPAAYGKSRLDPCTGRTPQKRKDQIRSLPLAPPQPPELARHDHKQIRRSDGTFPVGPRRLFARCNDQ